MLLSKLRALHPYLLGLIIGVLLVGTTLSVAVVAQARGTGAKHLGAAPTATVTATPALPAATNTNLIAEHPIGSDFAAYYQKNNGAAWLGKAISPEIPNQQNVEQIFEGGLLRLGPDTQNQVVREPVAQDLMQQTAMLPIADASSTITYADLAPPADGPELVAAPWWWDATKDPTVAGIFLAQTIREGVAYGYYIPAIFVPTLQKIGNWQGLIGSMTTQAKDGTFTRNGATHHFTLLGFTHAVLWYDRDSGATPTVHTQAVGSDYVAINGFPTTAAPKGHAAWTTGSPMAVRSSANGGNEIAHFLTPFSVRLEGDSKWVDHALWLHIRWTNFTKTRDGWVDADQLALSRPANLGMQLAALDALSPQAQAAANAYGDNVTMSIYDPASDHYYVYNPYNLLEMASMFKVPILVTLLHNAEHGGRELSGDEIADTTIMIEESDNDAEGRMYDDAGGYDAITNYMRSLGINDMQINTGGIGSTLLSPLSSVRLMELLRTGKVLNAKHTQYALDIMSKVVSYQRAGVCDTAPSGASCSMKIGYGPAINGFLMDAMGTVNNKGHVYDMAIYSANNGDFDTGVYTVDNICRLAVAAMF